MTIFHVKNTNLSDVIILSVQNHILIKMYSQNECHFTYGLVYRLHSNIETNKTKEDFSSATRPWTIGEKRLLKVLKNKA